MQINEWSQLARFGAAHRWQQQSSSHTTQCRLEVAKCIALEHYVVIHSFILCVLSDSYVPVVQGICSDA